MKKQSHFKKFIAPIVITAISVITLTMYILLFLFIEEITMIVKILIAIPVIALIGVSVAMLIERLKEIRSGEEDDISKY